MTALARVIDFETTGTPEDADPEVIEMGSYDVDIAARYVIHGNAWSSLCRPRGPIPAVTKAIHHIWEEDVADAPAARELWDNLLTANGEPQWLVAHNARFEMHFTPQWGIPGSTLTRLRASYGQTRRRIRTRACATGWSYHATASLPIRHTALDPTPT